ncbi:MAG: hypothetical protein PHZ00_06135 [Candidatus Peribacteraceae bacterium]|nr:hypothetical protein [Candidatus Peribacteraceae bacterium]
MIPTVALQRQSSAPALPKERVLRLEGASVTFTEKEIGEYVALSEKLYGVRLTEQEALVRCTMLVRFLRVVLAGGNAAADTERSGGQVLISGVCR